MMVTNTLHRATDWLLKSPQAPHRDARKRANRAAAAGRPRSLRRALQLPAAVGSRYTPVLERWLCWLLGRPVPAPRKLPYSVRSFPSQRRQDLLGGAIDWLTFRNVRTFYVRRGLGWTGLQIERLLRARGVRIGFHGVLHGEYFFEVPAQQAGLVELLLLKAGVPLLQTELPPAPTTTRPG